MLLPETQAASLNIAQEPLFLTQRQPPLVMLTMARDHKLYYEAYNDYSDLNADGTLDLTYKPEQIDYYGYFDSYKCYKYEDGIFQPATATNTPVFTNDSVDSNGVVTKTPMNAAEIAAERLKRKKCSNQWSGDWLNYVTTSRMDALRKVLYGGYRSTDTSDKTVLERVFVPQDAHAWGKEYKSVARDGYNISDFTPLPLPTAGNYHLFASVTLLASGDSTGGDLVSAKNSPPLLRVLNNTKFRVWEWLSIERPVAGDQCATGNNSRSSCTAGSVGGTWEVVRIANVLSAANDAKLYSYSHNRGHPNNRSEMDDLIKNGWTANRATGVSIDSIDCKDDNCDQDSSKTDKNYAVVITGNIVIGSPGTYNFAIDGDDAIDFALGANVSYDATTRTLSLPMVNDPTAGQPGGAPAGTKIPDPAVLTLGWYGGHGFANNESHNASKYLPAGIYPFVLRMEEVDGNDGYRLKYQQSVAASVITDYKVRVEVCNPKIGLEANCRTYGSGGSVSYKPTGLLQKYGENDSMYFGLISGSYRNNTRGGVLRRNVASINDEINSTTGQLNSTVGIIKTIDRLRITDFNYGSYSYGCGWITTRAMKNGECNMWGNPLGEMVYEAIRYFAGKAAPTASFVANVSDSSTSDSKLELPLASWVDPYRSNGGFPTCSKPYLMAISDVYPSFDSDSIPGSRFCVDEADTQYPCGSTFGSGDFDMETVGQSLWDKEFGAQKSIFIGQAGAGYDNAPTPKSVTSFGNIRGLSPSEPTRQGSFSSAIAAYYGHMTDLSSANGSQKATAYAVALAPPLPTIEVPMGSNKITIVPFAKSVGGSSIQADISKFQPTDQIVDFYIDDIANTTTGDADATVNEGRPYYKFRINYEDVEQGADHDMDAIATYEIRKLGDNLISVSISSDYAAGGINQHMGYVISGAREVSAVLTNGVVTSTCDIASGASNSMYLDVRDSDTSTDADVLYDRDTGYDATACGRTNVGAKIGLSRTRYFRVDTSVTASSLLKDPLWFMAKYGGFSDDNNNGIPDVVNLDTNKDGVVERSYAEWDVDGDGVPDNYFLVVNPLMLEKQLGAALESIINKSGTAAALATNSTSLRTSLKVYQARFSGDGWMGELNAYPIADMSTGTLGAASWQVQRVLGDGGLNPDSRVLITYDPDRASAIPFRWSEMSPGGTLQLSLNKMWTLAGGASDGKGESRVLYLRGATPTGFRPRPCVTGTSGGTCVPNYLGDIVNSAPQYVGVPIFGYSLTSYKAFFDAKKNRPPMIYVGSNDGMLHGFDADSGAEKLGYVPSQVYRGSRLSKLTAPDYGKNSNPHAFYVDGTPTIGDVCSGNCDSADSWHSMLVAGLGAGGQGIYALDITDPGSFTEAMATSIVKWEFTDANDRDLGYTFSRPAIVRICNTRKSATDPSQGCGNDGADWRWVVIFGNGYGNDEADGLQSTSQAAHLYIVDALSGALLKKLSTTDAASPNGFATVAPIDADGDGIADYAYGGDLNGSMWKFDLSSGSGAKVAYRLYQSQTEGGAAQPISTTAEVVAHPLGGVMVVFGTGKYLETTDRTSKQQQTVYGIWDIGSEPATALTRSNLQKQELLSPTLSAAGTVFATSTANNVDWGAKRGWYLDLGWDGSTPSERVGYDPRVIGKLLNVVTIIPSTDVCDYGGSSWDFFLDPLSGARPLSPVFKDVAKIAIGDGVNAFPSRRQSTVGITPSGTVITSGSGTAIVYKGGSSGEMENFGINLQGFGRLSWRELISD